MRKAGQMTSACLLAIFGLFISLGCQSRTNENQLKKISIEEYQQLSPEDREDPYVLQHLETSPSRLSR